MKITGAFFFSVFLAGTSIPAGAANFCGKVDFRSVTNLDLENIMFSEDLARSRAIPRSQCGFPGETLNLCSACAQETSEDMMGVLRPVLGTKEHLGWHDQWHRVRALQDPPEDAVYERLKEKGLFPGDLAKEEFLKDYVYALGGKKAGENFFFMHRLMIKMVQFELSMSGLPCIASWKDLPNKEEPGKSDAETLKILKGILTRFTDPQFLRKTSLNSFGHTLEVTLHQRLHEYYRGPVTNGKACSPEGLAQGYCDDLLPNGTSPLNKYFWKIHGLVDDLLGHWLKTNGYREISNDCGGKNSCYQWSATWVGKYPRGL